MTDRTTILSVKDQQPYCGPGAIAFRGQQYGRILLTSNI